LNAQSSRGIIVPIQVGAVKIYVAAVEALKKKERQSETHVAAVEALKKKERQSETQESSKLMVF
jgi:hypothetical protein